MTGGTVRRRLAAALAGLLASSGRAAAVRAEDVAEEEPAAALPEPDPALTVFRLIEQAALRHGVNPGELLAVAWCESRFNQRALSPSGAMGLLQFMPATWRIASRAAGWAGASPFDPVAAADVGAYWYARHPEAWWCRPTQWKVR